MLPIVLQEYHDGSTDPVLSYYLRFHSWITESDYCTPLDRKYGDNRIYMDLEIGIIMTVVLEPIFWKTRKTQLFTVKVTYNIPLWRSSPNSIWDAPLGRESPIGCICPICDQRRVKQLNSIKNSARSLSFHPKVLLLPLCGRPCKLIGFEYVG